MIAYKKAVVAAHPKVEGAFEEAQKIADFLNERGCAAVYGSLYDASLRRRTEAREFNVLIALGGDGTMLRAGNLCAPHSIPILGIKMGHFGFLTELERGNWAEILPRLLQGDFWLEKRMMLRCEHWHENELKGSWDILNEAVVSRGHVGRPVQLTAAVDGRFLTDFVADGLIVSTPTGSTAYAMAAGGPILPPELRNILLVPLAPHLSVDRSIVLAEGSSVSITVHTLHQAILCNDGQDPITLQDGDRVDVRASIYTVQFIRFQDPGYFYRNLTPHMNQNPSFGAQR